MRGMGRISPIWFLETDERPPTMNHPDDLNPSKRVARAKIGLLIHLAVYVLVNALLIGINLSTPSAHYWFVWPLAGWGLGLLAHAVAFFLLARGSAAKPRTMVREAGR
jgi:hypothetical protein